MNLVGMITEAAKDQLLKKISSSLGQNESMVSSAFGSMIPSILGAVAGKASDANGASQLLDFIGKSGLGDGFMDNIGDMLGDSSKQEALMNQGGGALDFLFGQSKVGSIIDIIGKFTGMKGQASGSIMRMVAPFVIGMIGRHIKQKALNPAAIASMFMGQRDNIQNAMPAGLMSQLGGVANFAASGGGSCSTTSGKSCSTSSKKVSPAVAAAHSGNHGQAKSGGSGLGWILPLLFLGIALWALSSLFGGGGDILETAKSGVAKVGSAAGSVADGAANMAGSVADVAKEGANVVGDAAGSVGGMVEGAAGAVGDVAKGAAGAVGDVAGGAVNVVKEGADAVGNAADSMARGAADMADTVAGAADSMAEVAKGGAEAVGDIADGATQMAKDGMDAAASAATTAVASIALPGNTKISTPKGSFTERLVTYLSTEGKQGSSFDFDRVNFESGSARITADSAEQLGNLAKVMTAYESLKIQVQGHTDNTGNAELNKKLSMQRATSVKEALVAGGIAEMRIDAAGFGAASPVADNGTPEGRLQNRRVSVAILER